MSNERIVIFMLVAVISAYLFIVVVATVACIWYESRCAHVDFKYFLGEPLSLLSGLLGGKFLFGKTP